jgi:hypothetical protein
MLQLEEGTRCNRGNCVFAIPDRVLQLMRSLARNVGTMTGVKTLARDVAGAE